MRYGVMLLTVLTVGCGGLRESPPKARPGSQPSTAPSVPGSPCAYPSVRPSYIPWLAPGAPVPEPVRDRSWGAATLLWHTGGTPRPGADVNYLSLWRVNDDLGGPGAPAPDLPNGTRGFLYESESDDDVADWAIVWADSGADGCNQMTMTLFMGQSSKEEGRHAIIEVARSLVEVS
jgi:hypothetical protein